MSVEQGIKAIEDVQKFYTIYQVGSWPNCNNSTKGTVHDIWGAAIMTGHAEASGSYGRNMQEAMKAALEATMIVPDDRRQNPFLSHKNVRTIGGYNDNYIVGVFDEKMSLQRMRLWLRRAKAWLKEPGRVG